MLLYGIQMPNTCIDTLKTMINIVYQTRQFPEYNWCEHLAHLIHLRHSQEDNDEIFALWADLNTLLYSFGYRCITNYRWKPIFHSMKYLDPHPATFPYVLCKFTNDEIYQFIEKFIPSMILLPELFPGIISYQDVAFELGIQSQISPEDYVVHLLTHLYVTSEADYLESIYFLNYLVDICEYAFRTYSYDPKIQQISCDLTKYLFY